MNLTYHCSVAAGRRIHALQGGDEGLKDADGRRRWLKGMTWCRIENRAAIYLAETNMAPTCRTCLRALAAHERRASDRR